MPTVQINHMLSNDDFARYTHLAQNLGYPDLTAFLQREGEKALFALTLPPAQQLGLRPDSPGAGPNDAVLPIIDLTQGRNHNV